ncbi:UAA transporter family protein [Nitzschia inconspicua]|uniref:UAA transporter family protein n=1 Tax=Nitzschia inconspicua TaxID=303405 RepID=A0A9K3PXH4_9STRA|nr:UAA transporter family protein [Nitzschia inconspicua]
MSRQAKKRTSSEDGEDFSLDDDVDNNLHAEASLLWCTDSVSQAAILYAFTFFFSMVVMELILEGTQNAFNDFLGLPYAVTLFQFIACFALPIAITKGQALNQLPTTIHELMPYIFLSLVAFGSTCFKSLSVRYVSFPTKVIFKSTKLIPTMIIATLFQHQDHTQHYGKRDYLAALLLCAGAAGYSYGESTKNDDKQDSYWGLLLLGISILCDAFTPNIQQRFMAPPTQASPAVVPVANTKSNGDSSCCKNRNLNIFSLILPPGGGGLGLSASVLMCNTNGVGFSGILLFMFSSGHGHDAIGVALERPQLFGNLVLIGFFLALAVLAHIRLIKESGAVVAVAVATLREVATVILSYVVYPKVFSMMHALSALLVLGGILLTITCNVTASESVHCSGTASTISNPKKTLGSRIELPIAHKS